MSKTQRELLMFGGILVVLGAILYFRLGVGGGGSTAPATPAQSQSTQAQPVSLPGGVTPGTVPPGGQPSLLAQYPLEFPEPGLTDSAVTARIYSGAVGDPFASDRGRPTRTSQPTTRPQRPQPRTPPPRQEIRLEKWPPSVVFQGLLPVADSPGVFRARFNGRIVRVGERILPTEYILAEANQLRIRIRWEDTDSNIHRIYDYFPPPPKSDLP